MVRHTYLAQRVYSGEILGQNGQLLPVWEEASEAARFSSRLSCSYQLDTWLKEHGGGLVDDGDYFAIRKVAEDAQPVALHDPNVDIYELIGQIAHYHDHYCKRVAEWVTATCGVKDPKRPDAKICLNSPTHAGIWKPRDYSCTYTLGYAMLAGIESFQRIVIAHEVVHAYQNHFSGVGAGHGGDFYGMMRHAAGVPVSAHTHPYDVIAGTKLAKGLIPWYKREIHSGRLVSAACQVLTDLDKMEGDIDCR